MARFVNDIKFQMAEVQNLRFKQAEQIAEVNAQALKQAQDYAKTQQSYSEKRAKLDAEREALLLHQSETINQLYKEKSALREEANKQTSQISQLQ